jgi:radical SAM protein with 4Fe4S-binding SPASM domain
MQKAGGKLDWIEGFVQRIRPYVHVRLTDNVLIRMPNEAFRLNRTGARVLHHLLQGGTLEEILQAGPGGEARAEQVASFFADLRRLLSAEICDAYQSATLERIPFALGYIELPVLSEVALTWRCNLRCSFCYAACAWVGEGKEADDRHELGTDEVKAVLRIIRDQAEVPSVSFTGGEPALRSDLAALVEYAAGRLGMRVNLITNGTLIDTEFARALRAAGLASAQVSIESPEPAVHDRIVGMKGAFRASLAGLTALRDAGVTVHPHTTLCRLNRETLPGMAELAKTLGTERFSGNLVIPAGRGADPELSVSYSEVREVVLAVLAAAKAAGTRFLWYSPTPVCLFNPLAHQLGNKGCSACEGLLSVDPYGRLLPCSSWKEPVGDLLREGFKALWFGERARRLRTKREAHPDCRRLCEHFALCHGACPLYFKAHGYRELEPVLARLSEQQTLPACVETGGVQ